MKLLNYLLISIMFCLLSACSLLLTDPLEYPDDQFVEMIQDMQVDMFQTSPTLNPSDLEITGNQTYVDATLQDLGVHDQMTIDEMQDQMIINTLDQMISDEMLDQTISDDILDQMMTNDMLE